MIARLSPSAPCFHDGLRLYPVRGPLIVTPVAEYHCVCYEFRTSEFAYTFWHRGARGSINLSLESTPLICFGFESPCLIWMWCLDVIKRNVCFIGNFFFMLTKRSEFFWNLFNVIYCLFFVKGAPCLKIQSLLFCSLIRWPVSHCRLSRELEFFANKIVFC